MEEFEVDSVGAGIELMPLRIRIGLGLKYRHDLEGARGKAMRGWKGLALVEVRIAAGVAVPLILNERSLGALSLASFAAKD